MLVSLKSPLPLNENRIQCEVKLLPLNRGNHLLSQARGNPTSYKGTEENLEGAVPKAAKAAFPRRETGPCCSWGWEDRKNGTLGEKNRE